MHHERRNNEKNDCQPQEPRDHRSMHSKPGGTRILPLCPFTVTSRISAGIHGADATPLPGGKLSTITN